MRLPRVVVGLAVLCAVAGTAGPVAAAPQPGQLSPTPPFAQPAPRTPRPPHGSAHVTVRTNFQHPRPGSLPSTGAQTPVQLVLAAILLLSGVTLARVIRRGTLPA